MLNCKTIISSVQMCYTTCHDVKNKNKNKKLKMFPMLTKSYHIAN